MKRAPAQPAKLTPEQCQAIEQAVFERIEKELDPRFYLLAVNFEKETGAWYLRLYIEGQNFAVSLSDCEQVSRLVDPLVEVMPQLMDLSYSLEVSSPGVFRPLRTPREFEFYQNRVVRIEEQPAEKKAAPVQMGEGILKHYDPANRKLTLKSPHSDEVFEVSLSERNVVCLNPELRIPEE